MRQVPAVVVPPDPAALERERRLIDDMVEELRDELEAMRRKGRLRTGSVSIRVAVDLGWARAYRLKKLATGYKLA